MLRSTERVDDLGVAQLVARYLGVVEAASSSLVTQTNSDSYEQAICSSESLFLFQKLYNMHYFVHIRVIKMKISTQKSQRGLDVLLRQTLFFSKIYRKNVLFRDTIFSKLFSLENAFFIYKENVRYERY